MVALLDVFRPRLIGFGTYAEGRVGNTLECDNGGRYEFRSFQEVPDTAKRIIILDKQSTPQLRISQSNTTRV
ncbi:hypothetical protein KY289_017709 [Solanum tuberosum]|nr:hypothetical protein KY289_017709 [Solanum tuberosum]